MLRQECFIKIQYTQEDIDFGALAHPPEDDVSPKSSLINGFKIHEKEQNAQTE